ncbi:hypothetical protein [Enterococcus avium]|uniref:hypothetical protein n=1 Tax=Enterococcus avium TaxID=33945 RepID=UPI001F58F42A|nr:hypothetical protein [Enterococcus avium]
MEKLFKNKYFLIILGVVATIILRTFIFSFFGGVVTKEEWDALQIGMNVQEIEKEIGKPRKSETDLLNISGNVYSEYKKMSELNNIVSDDNLESRMSTLRGIIVAIDLKKNVEEYTYIEKSPSGKRNVQIYFINDVAKYFNRETQ